MLLSVICLVSLLFIIPILIGLVGTWLPAMGYLPSIGSDELSISPLLDVLNHPSTLTSVKTSLSSALIATLVAFTASQLLCMSLYKKRGWVWLKSSIAPLLAIPHLAFAIGFAFVIAPSGWIVRWVSPALSGFSYPPDWLIVNDNYALSLTVALIIKEIPFFLLMSFSAMNHLQVDKTLHLAATFKYSHSQAWVKLIFPQMFAQLRLPFYAVLSYSLSVVDLSVVLGPTTPATFAVLITQWFNDADTSYRLMASSAASLLLLMVISIIAVFYLLEWIIKKSFIGWLVKGPKMVKHSAFSTIIAAFGLLFVWITTFSSIAVLVVWSFSKQWRFPDALPTLWALKYWKKSAEQLSLVLYNTALVGVASATIAVVLCIFVLQWQSARADRGKKIDQGKALDKSFWMLGIIYLPILIPQVSFLFGIQILLVKFHLEGLMSSLIWSHLIFVLPYCYLSLAKSYLHFDERYFQIAAMLSRSKWRAFIYIKLPMLLRPIAFSFAIGFAVSVSQYLPSLYVGAGRIDTITLNSVALASGSDLRVTAVFALWQFLLPLIVYFAAIFIPQYIFRNRRGM